MINDVECVGRGVCSKGPTHWGNEIFWRLSERMWFVQACVTWVCVNPPRSIECGCSEGLHSVHHAVIGVFLHTPCFLLSFCLHQSGFRKEPWGCGGYWMKLRSSAELGELSWDEVTGTSCPNDVKAVIIMGEIVYKVQKRHQYLTDLPWPT